MTALSSPNRSVLKAIAARLAMIDQDDGGWGTFGDGDARLDLLPEAGRLEALFRIPPCRMIGRIADRQPLAVQQRLHLHRVDRLCL
jgi:hypothetical protein